MIWLKENDELVGYVPILKKEYSDAQIRRMSEYCQSDYKGWSKLSTLVMHIQGISYAYISKAPVVAFFEAPIALYDIKCDLFFECSSNNSSDPRIKSYINQIFDVFENLTLYKVEQHSISDISKKFDETASYLNHFLNQDIFFSIRNDFNRMLSTASKNAISIQELFEVFSDNELVLSHSLFKEADDELIEELKRPRENLRSEKLVKSIYD